MVKKQEFYNKKKLPTSVRRCYMIGFGYRFGHYSMFILVETKEYINAIGRDLELSMSTMAAGVCCRLLLKWPLKSVVGLETRCAWRAVSTARQLSTVRRLTLTRTPSLATGYTTVVCKLHLLPGIGLYESSCLLRSCYLTPATPAS